MTATLFLGSSVPIALAAAQLTPPTLPPSPRPAPSGRTLFAWIPGPVMCDRNVVRAAVMRRPLTALVWRDYPETLHPVTYRFRLQPNGRPLSITRIGNLDVAHGEDIAPSLAASRFTIGPARDDCAITYTARLTTMDESPVADLIAYAVTDTDRSFSAAGWARIKPAGDCHDAPLPRALRYIQPNFLALPMTRGAESWSMTGYDLNAQGRPIHVRTVEGMGNAALDAAAVKAMKASRFTRGPRTGCLHPLRQIAGTVPAPAIPDRIGEIATASRCPNREIWAYYPLPTFPEPWRRRAIEGWAVISFDVAPSGVLDNLRVIASEPAADFGREALRLRRGSRKLSSDSGHAGCIERIRFAMRALPRRDRPAPSAADQP